MAHISLTNMSSLDDTILRTTGTTRHSRTSSRARTKSKSRRKSVIQLQLETQREQTLHDLRNDKGIREWRKDSDIEKLHHIEHAQFRELERLSGLSSKDVAGLSSKDVAIAAASQLNTKSIELISRINTSQEEEPKTGPSQVQLDSKKNKNRKILNTIKEETRTGAARFKKAAKKVQMNNRLRQTFNVSIRRATALEHHVIEKHCHSCIGPMKMFLHFVSLLVIWMLSQSLWTYDGLDAVEMLEDQILRGSLFDHYSSKFTDVDSHTSFQEWAPTLITKIFALPVVLTPVHNTTPRSILRYRKKKELEDACVPKYLNQSYPFTKDSKRSGSGDSSYSYKVFRPVSNSGNSPGFSTGGLVYLSDGMIVRQLRGTVKKGMFKPNKQKSHCGSMYIAPSLGTDYHTFTSGAWGLYMKYPSNQGYDLYFSAEDRYQDIMKKYRDSVTCGWIDPETRAVVFIFTLTYFSELEKVKQPPNTVIDAKSSYDAYGPQIEINVKLIFDMPSNGLVRSTYEFSVVDRSDVALKWICFFGLCLLNLTMGIFHITDINYLGVRKYCRQWRHVLQLLALGVFWVAVAAYLWADQRQKFAPFDSERVQTDATYGQYKCSSLAHVEENAEKTSTRIFFFLFSSYAIIEFWMLIHYLRVSLIC